MEKINTDVYGLGFYLKGKRLCFEVDSSGYNKWKRYWVDLPTKALAAISKVINEHLEAEAEERKLTPEQLAEKYKEYGGS